MENLILPVIYSKIWVNVWHIFFQDQSVCHSIHKEQFSYACRFYQAALFSRPTPMLSRKKPKVFCPFLWLICCCYKCKISKYTHIYCKQTVQNPIRQNSVHLFCIITEFTHMHFFSLLKGREPNLIELDFLSKWDQDMKSDLFCELTKHHWEKVGWKKFLFSKATCSVFTIKPKGVLIPLFGTIQHTLQPYKPCFQWKLFALFLSLPCPMSLYNCLPWYAAFQA